MNTNWNDATFARRCDWMVTHVWRPILYVLTLLGSSIALLVRMECHALASQVRLGAGYSPASNQTSNLIQSQVNYYDKNFVNSGDLTA